MTGGLTVATTQTAAVPCPSPWDPLNPDAPGFHTALWPPRVASGRRRARPRGTPACRGSGAVPGSIRDPGCAARPRALMCDPVRVEE